MKIGLIRHLLIFMIISVSVHAQKGVIISTQVGLSDIGSDIWYETNGDLTFSALVPINSTFQVGGFYTIGLSPEYSVFVSDEVNFDASYSEYGLIGRFIVYRTGKFSIYAQALISIINFEVTEFPDPSDPEPLLEIDEGSDSFVGLGIGVGFQYKLSNRFTLNIFEFDATYINNVQQIDQSIQRDYKLGIAYQFQRTK